MVTRIRGNVLGMRQELTVPSRTAAPKVQRRAPAAGKGTRERVVSTAWRQHREDRPAARGGAGGTGGGGSGAGSAGSGGGSGTGAARRYRAADLAAEVGISVQLLRSYQSKGLLPPPRHEGRVAWYGPHHRERLLHIRHLKERGFSLRMIAEALDEGAEAPVA